MPSPLDESFVSFILLVVLKCCITVTPYVVTCTYPDFTFAVSCLITVCSCCCCDDVRLASRVLCATLAVPLPAARNQTDQLLDLDDGGVEKQKRLAALLSLNSLPTRQSLVKELVSA